MKWVNIVVFLGIWLGTVTVAQAAMVHLNSGEALSGRIQSMDDQTLTLESDRGFGILQIDRADIRMIEFEGNERDLSRKFGVGFYQRGTVAQEFSVGMASLKYWLNSSDSVDLLMGFGSTTDGGDKLEEVLDLRFRFTRVMLQEGGHDLYWGGSLGVLNVNDDDDEINESGSTVSAFLGIEMFFIALPNVGISSEIGVTNQTVGDRTTFGIFNTGFPTLSVRYYF